MPQNGRDLLDRSVGKLNLPPGIGKAGEAAAHTFVSKNLGYKILETNFRTPAGEIDIVAKSGETLVFIEVKTRTNRAFGYGVEQISSTKAMKLQLTGQRFLEVSGNTNADWRIDLLSVLMTKIGQVTDITHIENAIEFQH